MTARTGRASATCRARWGPLGGALEVRHRLGTEALLWAAWTRRAAGRRFRANPPAAGSQWYAPFVDAGLSSGPNAAWSLPIVVVRQGLAAALPGSLGAMEVPRTVPQPYLGLVLEKLRRVSRGAITLTWPRGRGGRRGRGQPASAWVSGGCGRG